MERGYQKPLSCPLISRACLHDKHPRLKFPLNKRQRRTNGDAKGYCCHWGGGNRIWHGGQTQEVIPIDTIK